MANRSPGVDTGLPVIEMTPLFGRDRASRAGVAGEIGRACREHGFFYVTGHGIDPALCRRLEEASRRFFALPAARKMEISMDRGGPAWRGFFPVGGELTSGRPDLKEGLYFGSELAPDDPRVVAGWPLHGSNLWPAEPAALREATLDYMAGATRAGAALMEGVSLSLGLAADWFERHYTADPTILFRIFNYPHQPEAGREAASWGVGEHTDYGLLTLLYQDDNGGLQVRTPGGWIDAPPLDGTLVCNIGDMLDRLTGGRYLSTPHRVRNAGGRDRLSFPLFFDPDFSAAMRPLPGAAATNSRRPDGRWDNADLQAFEGSYGDYLLDKVSKVFPGLGREVL